MFSANFIKTVFRSGITQFNLSTCRLIHGKAKRNYYEVLKLKQNCTSKDIKRAYIDLTKKYHPDINNNVDAQQFLEVSEAYSVLSKDDLRRNYDSVMFPNHKSKMKHDRYYGQSASAFKRNPMDDPSFFTNRDKTKDKYYESKPYYGVKGVQRMSNSVILLACLLLMAVGVAFQVLAIRHSVTFHREALMFKSTLANKSLQQTRKNAEENGNEMQLAILEEKFRCLE